MLGENGHGTWAPESQEIYFGGDDTMLGENGHGQWNPEMWQEEEAGDQPWFEARSGPSGDAQSGPSGMGGGPSGDFGRPQKPEGWFDEFEYGEPVHHKENKFQKLFNVFNMIPHFKAITHTLWMVIKTVALTDFIMVIMHRFNLDGWMPKPITNVIDMQIHIGDRIRNALKKSAFKVAQYLAPYVKEVIDGWKFPVLTTLKNKGWTFPIYTRIQRVIEHLKENKRIQKLLAFLHEHCPIKAMIAFIHEHCPIKAIIDFIHEHCPLGQFITQIDFETIIYKIAGSFPDFAIAMPTIENLV